MQKRWHYPRPSGVKKIFAKNSVHTFEIILGICSGARMAHELAGSSGYLHTMLMRAATLSDMKLA
ncbi:hypothetical protein Plhal710r2_c032g0118101 [Plasmopara halstedii]